METRETQKGIEIIGDANRSVPKFCTSVNFSRLKNGDIVMQFLHSRNNTSENNSTSVLIESIIVDGKHAQKIAEVLNTVIKEDEN